ncbi:hypothetical protein TNCV_296701 [Trichonephila clavipes]|nr:hypothetical protein TNCV_296701 [Trichonephila clavipes]
MKGKAYCAQLSIRDLGPEVHEQMFWLGGESDAKTPSVKFPSKFGAHLSTHRRDERLDQSFPAGVWSSNLWCGIAMH